MKFEKLIHVTYSKETNTVAVQQFAQLRQLGLKEIIFFLPPNGDKWKTQVEELGVHTRTVQADGPIVPAVLDAAHREGVSFISTNMDAQRVSLFRQSFAEKLLNSSDVPVMLMPGALDTPAAQKGEIFDHVIFATDWSESCQKVMHYLLLLEGIIKELEIIHVAEKRLSVKEMRKLKYRLSAWRSAFLDRKIDAESHIYAGKVHEEILLAAKDYEGTCIVMGASERSPVERILRHSCSYRVAEACKVPTIIVP